MTGPQEKLVGMLGLSQILPVDAHNQRLVDNVRPADWVNPVPAGRYDLAVIGGGTAGLVAAVGAAALGARVALVERSLLGGDCLNVGCVPSKALIRSALAAAETRRTSGLGIRLGTDVETDFGAVMERVRRTRADLSQHDAARRFRELGVDVFLGQAGFAGADSLDVEGARLEFSRACIASGSRPNVPDIPGLEASGFHTNETLFTMTGLPRRLGVIGGGPIGCEMAQAFARLGSEVWLLQRSKQLLNREDREAAHVVRQALADDGVHVELESDVVEVKPSPDGKRITIASSPPRTLPVDEILVAVGRRPIVQELNLERAGIDYDERSGVQVDGRLRTTNARVYAAGDVCLPYRFTHTADASARIVIRNALFLGRQRIERQTVPWCTYTDPAVARVGLNARQARRKGIDIHTLRVEMNEVDRAVVDGETDGFLEVHLRRRTDQILGATLVSRRAGDIISVLTTAMESGIGLKSIGRTIFPYPTQGEVIKKVADAYNRSRLTPWRRAFLRAWLRFRR